MVEYGLLMALIAIISLAAVGSTGRATEEKFEVIAAGMGGIADENVGGPAGEGSNLDESGAPSDSDLDDSGAPSDSDPDDSGAPSDSDPDDSGAPEGSDEDAELEGQVEGGGQEEGDQENDPPDSESDDENGAPGGGEAIPETEPTEDPVVPGSTVANTGSTGSFYWWNRTNNGGEGAWKSSVSYTNEWIRHQYLTLEVTRVDEKGKRSTTTVRDFYVPAGGSANYETWDNQLSINRDTYDGVMSIEIKVTGIRTSDEAWQTVSYPSDGPITIVGAPQAP